MHFLLDDDDDDDEEEKSFCIHFKYLLWPFDSYLGNYFTMQTNISRYLILSIFGLFMNELF